MNWLKNKIWIQVFVIYTRYLIGGTFVFASLIKIKGKRFTGDSGELHSIDSAWHFFETLYQSGVYWQFIGISQLLAGLLLMTQRYSKLGALINFPIILNIFIITISYDFNYTPVITALILTANVLLLVWEWDELKILLNLGLVEPQKHPFEKDVVWQLTGLALFLFTFIYRLFVDHYDVFLWGITCSIIGLVGLFVGLKRHRILIR